MARTVELKATGLLDDAGLPAPAALALRRLLRPAPGSRL